MRAFGSEQGKSGGACDAPRNSEEWLILRAQAGDVHALEQVLTVTMQRLRPFVDSLVGDRDASDDVMQDTMILLVRHLRHLREPRALTAWARRIAAREAVRLASRSKRIREVLAEFARRDRIATDSATTTRPCERDLKALLQEVSPNSRVVLTLHYLEGLTIAEVAATLGLPEGTVKSRLAYGLSMLRRNRADG